MHIKTLEGDLLEIEKAEDLEVWDSATYLPTLNARHLVRENHFDVVYWGSLETCHKLKDLLTRALESGRNFVNLQEFEIAPAITPLGLAQLEVK